MAGSDIENGNLNGSSSSSNVVEGVHAGIQPQLINVFSNSNYGEMKFEDGSVKSKSSKELTWLKQIVEQIVFVGTKMAGGLVVNTAIGFLIARILALPEEDLNGVFSWQNVVAFQLKNLGSALTFSMVHVFKYVFFDEALKHKTKSKASQDATILFIKETLIPFILFSDFSAVNGLIEIAKAAAQPGASTDAIINVLRAFNAVLNGFTLEGLNRLFNKESLFETKQGRMFLVQVATLLVTFPFLAPITDFIIPDDASPAAQTAGLYAIPIVMSYTASAVGAVAGGAISGLWDYGCSFFGKEAQPADSNRMEYESLSDEPSFQQN